jgi:O-antigen/teichoic acid export membrane protein
MDLVALAQPRDGNADAISPATSLMRALLNSAFFRQSAWMLFATLATGVFMAGVNAVVLHMDREETGAFLSLLDVLALLSTPITAVLTVFMQQTVLAITDDLRRQLVTAARGIILAMCCLWLVVAIGTALFQETLLANLKLQGATAWWLTMFSGLVALIIPTLTGMLQGEQKFGLVGFSQIVNGVGRFAGVLIAVKALNQGATGAMTGVLLGNLFTLALVGWGTRWLWRAPGAPCDWKRWIREALPLMLGLGAPTFIFTQDMLVVQQHYEYGASAAYGAPRVVGRILFFLVVPMTTVMFPKIARSAAMSERTDVLAQAIGATALVCGGTAVVCTLFPDLMIKMVTLGKPGYAQTAWLIPWFAWALLPLALSNLLVNNLLARKRFEAVPWLVLVAAGYGITVRYFTYTSYISVVSTLGVFSTLLFALSLFFSLRQPRPAS